MRVYLLITGAIFAVVALLHLLRIASGWSLVVGSWSAPMWASWGGLLLAGVFSAWAFRLAAKR